ncbi:PfkB family carbohydrate kinase [Colletotrichum musicola]|uniref:PfkB family carbohydrate kinase n=1 Tax=Colletotrichum musicola TaxID=2175873 RepID=A0A8H6U7K6_9PEZI|nr:PfkB family carbohydrate kinase [Colletotrichum musicola]
MTVPAVDANASTPGPEPEPGPELAPPAFVSLGMVVLDEIHFPDGRVLRDVPGGSGFYATLGARLAVPQNRASSVCCLVVAGDDFPAAVARQIEGWGAEVRVQRVEGASSTRGLLRYEDDVFGAKTFRYTSPPLRTDVKTLPDRLLQSSVVHTLASPEDVTQQALDLRSLGARPLIAWEPSPLHCAGASAGHARAAGYVDVVSPNDAEVLAMYGISLDAAGPYDRAAVERCAMGLAGDEVSSNRGRVVVIRCGAQGCLTFSRGRPIWLPAFHGPGSGKVVDATGAGNSFLGAFAVGLRGTGDAVLASAYGAVAASFVVEQVGPPRREIVDGREVWNGEEFGVRLEEYKAKMATVDAGLEAR